VATRARPSAEASDDEPPRRGAPWEGAGERRRPTLAPLVRVALILALLALVALEAGSPILTRADLADAAREAAHRAAVDLIDHGDLERSRGVAQSIADENDAVLESFSVDQRGVRVVLERQASSFILKHWDTTAGWYDVEATATAASG
ncbi:MAG: hypothetical protein M3Q48_15980, partial [Actinomycetota bacterium]|nr:hypothetical protein [Actinomycetota bacterium]